jgi:hypothetical protein
MTPRMPGTRGIHGAGGNGCRSAAAAVLIFLCSILLGSPSKAQQSSEAVAKISVVQQKWRKDGEFMIADLILRNDNAFPVTDVIVSCELYGEKAKPEDKRGIAIRKALPPGTTEIPGLEFSIAGTDAQGGPCHVIAAEPGI